MLVSVCISTWCRINILKKIIEKIENQTFCKDDYEIIIADSMSNDGTYDYMQNVIKEYTNIKYLYNIKNSLQSKRKAAISHAVGDVIILLDDDVVPQRDDFIECHYKANRNSEKCFFSGQIRFPVEKVKKSNYFNFRDKQHFANKDILVDIPFYKIVAMNMSFKKKYLNNVGEFDERFLGYGCEDTEFGYRIEHSGFHNKYLKEALALHYEESLNIVDYGKKIYKTSVYGKRNLYIINYDCYKSLNQNKIENKCLVFDIIFNKFFSYVISVFLMFTDSFSFFYSYHLYKYYIYCILYRGFKDRDKIDVLKDSWVK